MKSASLLNQMRPEACLRLVRSRAHIVQTFAILEAKLPPRLPDEPSFTKWLVFGCNFSQLPAMTHRFQNFAREVWGHCQSGLRFRLIALDLLGLANISARLPFPSHCP